MGGRGMRARSPDAVSSDCWVKPLLFLPGSYVPSPAGMVLCKAEVKSQMLVLSMRRFFWGQVTCSVRSACKYWPCPLTVLPDVEKVFGPCVYFPLQMLSPSFLPFYILPSSDAKLFPCALQVICRAHFCT